MTNARHCVPERVIAWRGEYGLFLAYETFGFSWRHRRSWRAMTDQDAPPAGHDGAAVPLLKFGRLSEAEMYFRARSARLVAVKGLEEQRVHAVKEDLLLWDCETLGPMTDFRTGPNPEGPGFVILGTSPRGVERVVMRPDKPRRRYAGYPDDVRPGFATPDEAAAFFRLASGHAAVIPRGGRARVRRAKNGGNAGISAGL